MKKLPCEEAVWDTLPAIRAALAAEMVAAGLAQNKVASILGLAPSAVSQYLSRKRGYRIVFTPEVRKAVETAAAALSEGTTQDIRPLICEICILIRNADAPCEVCETDARGNPGST